LLSLKDINCLEEIPETQPFIEENASQKAFYVYNNYHFNCFADDTGLEVEALDGKPGVLSARYAGESKNADDNMNKLLHELKGISNRNARFKTVISLIIDGKETQFEGIVNGVVIDVKRGTKGFGYDPVFIPHGYNTTFAEMDLIEKNKISHRALAVGKLVAYLKDDAKF
jgi:XTP/dITP diphosphohydrolase